MPVTNYARNRVVIVVFDLGGTGLQVTGVKISTYKVSLCPTGGSYPIPVDFQTYKANGVLAGVTSLAANSTYLIAVDGIQNTKAIFDIEFSGSALPIKS